MRWLTGVARRWPLLLVWPRTRLQPRHRRPGLGGVRPHGTRRSVATATPVTGRQGAWQRFPWLCLTLLAGMLTAAVIARFSPTLRRLLPLATFIPLLIGMGGNSGTQALTVTIRALDSAPSLRQAWRLVRRELATGILLGCGQGILIGLIAQAWHGHAGLAFITGVAMALIVTVSTVLGTLVPMLFFRLGIDPAVASGPFISTFVDVIGLVVYLGLATLWLDLLGR